MAGVTEGRTTGVAEHQADGVIDAVAAIQRRSLDAAGALVERLAAAADRTVPATTQRAASGEADGDRPAAEVVDAWARLWRDSITSLAAALGDDAGTRPPRPSLEVGAAPVPVPVRLRHDPAAGDAGDAEVWLHNRTATDRWGLRIHVTQPVAHDGSRFPGSVLVDPEELDLPARSGRGVLLQARAEGAPPGTYRALVLVEGLPDQWLPLELHVDEPGP